ncbi:choline dehydrogenase, mitochondrial-like [Mytilus edulis]|uniref:choline dehydrogenase, mitochondrial-like n=1 Tax=Mytilus edulis TaxID=6550 RepID=UPI0039EEDFE5
MPVMSRRNLQISLKSYVTMVLIRRKRAYGVQFVKAGRTLEVFARKEVILSAGIFHNPNVDESLYSKVDKASHTKYPDGESFLNPFAFESPTPSANLKDNVLIQLLTRFTDSSCLVVIFFLHPKSKDISSIDTRTRTDDSTAKPTRLTSQKGCKGHCDEMLYNTDDYWRCMIRHFALSVHHHTAPCRMGSRVKGIRRLRVVMRNVPSGNTNAPTIMIAEKAADMIKQSRNI